MSELLRALRERLGAPGLLVEGDLSAYETDWRKRYPGRALAVVRPASTEEVAAVIAVSDTQGGRGAARWQHRPGGRLDP